MNRGAIAALVARNAQACENARTPRCRCYCGGQYHGAGHAPEWQAQVVEELARRLEDERQGPQLALELLNLEEDGAP